MKKIILIALTMIFFTHSAQREQMRQRPEQREPMRQQQREPERLEQSEQKEPERSEQREPMRQEQDRQEPERPAQREHHESERSEQREQQEPIRQEQERRKEEMRQEQKPKNPTEEIEAFFSFFPAPNQPEFALLPELNGIITLVYEETLGVPPNIFNAIKRIYTLLQILALEEDHVSLKHLSGQQRKDLNDQIMQRCLQSSTWQDYNKTFITESLEYGMSLLKSVHQQEKMIFTYIPSFETAYYSQGYTQVRDGAELVRLSLVLSDGMRERSLAQCEWSKLKNIDALYDEVERYQEGEFYLVTKKIRTLLKDPKKYHFPPNTPFVNRNGAVSPAFNHFVYRDRDGHLEVSEHAKILLDIDKNNQPYLTALGNFIFTYDTNQNGPSLRRNPIFNDLFLETTHGLQPTNGFLKIMVLDSIKIINAHIAYLFNATNLESTMQKLAELERKEPNILQRFPNILPYVPQDYPYLAGIQEVLPRVAQHSEPQAQVQGFFSWIGHAISSIGHAFESAADAVANVAKKAWNDVKKAGESLGKDILHGIEDFGRGVGSFFAATAMAFVHPSEAGGFFESSMDHFKDMASDVGDAMKQVGTIVTSTVSVAASLAGQTIGAILQDSKIGANLAGAVDAVVGGVVNIVVAEADATVSFVGDIFRLQAEAVEICAMSIAAIGSKSAEKEWFREGADIGKDIVTSMLTEVTFVTKAIGAALTAIMKGLAYLCASIVNLIGDVAGDLAALGATLAGGNALDALKAAQAGVHKWRRTIIGSIMLVGGLALTVATGGLSAEMTIPEMMMAGSMLVVGGGMMAIGTVGDVQQDIAAHKKMAFETTLLKKYSAAVPQQAIAAKACESSAMIEAAAQFATERENSERGLVYYQNFLNNQFNNTISTQSTALGNFYKQYALPDPATGVSSSDPGHLYGIKTERIALNPAGGLYTFNAARNTFAQEIATAPQQTHKTTQNTIFTVNKSSTGLWINQKDLSNVVGPQMLEVEVRWRTLYETEGNFYVGIFLSEQVMNLPILQALNKNYDDALKLSGDNAALYVEKTWENLDAFNRNLLNYNHLSRNLVIYRENGFTPTLGFYQHNGAGDGWINRDFSGIKYQRGVWYRMKMGIHGTTTRVKCWEEAGGEPGEWVTFTIPQAERFPTAKPINLPNDKDPFEINVPAPKHQTPKPEPQQTQERTPQREQQNSQEQSTQRWSVSKAKEDNARQTDQWHMTKAKEDLAAKTDQWHESQPQEDTGVQTQGWVLSGKEQRAKSETIDQALGSLGMITSGVAVEYQIVSPATVLEVMPARKKVDAKLNNDFKQEGVLANEKERGKQWLLKHGTALPTMQMADQAPNSIQDKNYSSQQNLHANNQNQEQNPREQNPREQKQQPEEKPQEQAPPEKPAHSTFWYLQHGQTPPSKANINSKISKDGKYASLGGPS
jgi:hypothetical protein